MKVDKVEADNKEAVDKGELKIEKYGNDFLDQNQPCVALDAPAMAAVMAAAVATLLTVEALPTQHAAALPTAAPAQAAVQQTNVLEAVHPAARSLAAPPSMITIIVWRIITGSTFLS